MSKTIALDRVPLGGIFTLDGIGFARLKDEDGGAILVVTESIPEDISCTQFEADDAEREDHNNFVGSLVQTEIVRWLGQHDHICAASVPRPIDLTTMDGITDYGCPDVVARLLTADEYRRNRRYIPLESRSYWLATGWTTASSPYSNTTHAFYVSAGGALYNFSVYDASFASRPALYLKSSILVSYNEAEKSGLDGYTSLDLLEELHRRIKPGEGTQK